MPEVYDIIIIGGGPGGLSAGIYAGRAKLKTAIIEKGREGGQAATTEELENYPGFFDGSTGPGVMDGFAAHARHFGAEIKKGSVTDVDFSGAIKKVSLKTGEELAGRCVILATGAEPRPLGAPGEDRLRGRGVSYCATCDADFFEELDIAVVGNGDAAIEEAMYLTKFANTVTMVVVHDEGTLNCNKSVAEKAFQNPKMEWLWNSVIEEIAGDELVEEIVVRNVKTGEITRKELSGVFVFVGTVPKTEFLRGKIELDGQGYIPTSDLMETNVEGVYAVGDVRAKFLRQVVTAASDGAIAAVAAEKHLAETEIFRNRVLEAETPVLLVFWSSRVEKSIAAIAMLEAAVGEAAGKIGLVKLNPQRNEKTAKKYGVAEVPTVLLFEGGELIGRLDGAFTGEELRGLIAGCLTGATKD